MGYHSNEIAKSLMLIFVIQGKDTHYYFYIFFNQNIHMIVKVTKSQIPQ